MLRHIVHAGIVLIVANALVANIALGGVPGAQKCQAGKNKEAGKLAFCLAKAEAKLIQTEGTCSVTTAQICYHYNACPIGESCLKSTTAYSEAVTKCTTKFQEKWALLEQKALTAGDPCPTTGEGIQSITEAFVADVNHRTDGTIQRVFVSSSSVPTGGNFGLAGADAHCQAAADAASLGGTWHAWLSTATVNAKDRIPEAEYRLLNGTKIADDKTDLTDGTLDAQIDRDEYGALVGMSGAYLVWTGTSAAGTPDPAGHCSNWSNNTNAQNGRAGVNLSTNSSWTSIFTETCNTTIGHLYCFEQ